MDDEGWEAKLQQSLPLSVVSYSGGGLTLCLGGPTHYTAPIHLGCMIDIIERERDTGEGIEGREREREK